MENKILINGKWYYKTKNESIDNDCGSCAFYPKDMDEICISIISCDLGFVYKGDKNGK